MSGRTLAESLGELLGRAPASFQLMGEDLALLPGARLCDAAAAYQSGLARIDEGLRPRFEAAQAEALREAHQWLTRYNRSVDTRLRGYLALGRRCGFAYPWPVVAMLGICQVMSGLERAHLYGVIGPLLARLGGGAIATLAERTDEILRRTNRGIFADSVPTVLYGLRAAELRRAGDAALADALLDGPLPPIMDEESRALARGLADGLALADGAARFAALAALTLRHFAREQAIFTHQMGPPPRRAPSGLVARLLRLDGVPAPLVVDGTVAFRHYPLPPGFAMGDHDARVAHFSRAFVTSICGELGDYRVAVRYVSERFGRAGDAAVAIAL